MIAHHAAARLMCEEAAIGDPEPREVCRTTRPIRQTEIDQVRAILHRLEK